MKNVPPLANRTTYTFTRKRKGELVLTEALLASPPTGCGDLLFLRQVFAAQANLKLGLM